VLVAEQQVEVWSRQLEDLIIRAPFEGVVVSKDAQPGEMISPVSAGGGFTRTGICTIVDMDSLEIEVDVNESYINRVEANQPVTATLDSYPDWKIPARVIAIIPTADRQKATVQVRIGFDRLDPRILPDMGVKVAFQDTSNEESQHVARLAIPDGGLIFEGDNNYVWVVDRDKSVERRAVSVGDSSQGRVDVLSGLRAGEQIVLNPPNELSDGDQVRVKEQ
jgi:RND family efflux transporter MFP subunit